MLSGKLNTGQLHRNPDNLSRGSIDMVWHSSLDKEFALVADSDDVSTEQSTISGFALSCRIHNCSETSFRGAHAPQSP